ncbi:chondroitinase family polysaccharide lyase [Flavivirga abyssicola]|uniref:chondroitinase family polysaccharide lyase n=1 Tax=Flavivirga abyssicola TaxID=3063533 RepID=UPI0026E0E2FE|nr:chondroitinase family polysaccharide lyase [Flavivirga sp. MEBiC07777]WVK12660.1 chondroitinase family polysaccharide lyase [Flavivirga sp. MEBiC07777]
MIHHYFYMLIKRNLIRFKLVLLIFICFQARVHAQDQSFEGTSVPSNWNAALGSLSISSNHYKLGSKSLQWDWSANDELTVTNLQAEGLVPAQVQSFFQNMFRIWIYNTNAINTGSLEIEFYDNNGVKQFNYPFYLNFTGWRAGSASYRHEMLGPKGSDNITTLKIKAPTSGSGTLHFDFIDYTMERNTDRSADYQLPFITLDNGKHWFDFMYFQSLPKTIPATTPSAQELADFNVVKQKYDDLILGNAPSNSNLNNAISAYNNQDIVYSGGIVTGKPLYGKDYGNAQNIDVVDGFIHTLARDYKHKNTATSLTYFLNTVRYLLDQGYADGSLLETMHHIGYSFRDVSKAIHLMKDELVTAGLWDEARKMVEWYAGTDIIWHPSAYKSNMDDALTRAISILGACLYKETDAEKVQYLKGYKQYVENWLTPRSLVSKNGVKVDYTGFHHGTYYPQYAFGAYKSLSTAVNFISGGVYGISNSKKDVFKNMLLGARVNMSNNDFPNGLSGRSPFNDISITSAYKNLGLSTPIDTQLLETYNGITGGDSQTNAYGSETLPTGFWQINYANLGTYRQDNWLAGIKGFNNYFWGTEIYSSDNRYGRYQSYGSIEILYPGGASNSGTVIGGWDWNKTPGATTIHLPFSSLKASKSRQDEFTDSNFASSLRFGTKNAYYIDDKIEGSYGMFGMDFTQKAITATHNPTFTFKKSVFCFDGKIICLGSNINNNDASNITATNLFQNKLSATSTPIQVDNVSTSNFPYNSTLNSSANHWIIDAYNTGYFVKSATVVIDRKNQVSPRENGRGGTTSGNFASAYINHGTAPVNSNYEYVIIPGTNSTDMIAFTNNMNSNATAFYEVLQHDDMAHIVKYNAMRGYALFNSGNFGNTATLKSNDAPCLIMTEETGNDLKMTVVNPDLNKNDTTEESQIKTINLVLNGEWTLNVSSGGAVNVTSGTNETTITIDTKDALPVDMALSKTALSIEDVDFNKGIIAFPNPTDSIINIKTLNKAIKIVEVNLIDETGKLIHSQKSDTPINVASFSNGIYFLTIKSRENIISTKKIIIKK